MATNYKATAAQARYIARLVAEKGWEPADLRANYGKHARALGDYGNAYLAGDTFVQIARGMNKKAASKFIDLLLDDSAEWAFPEAPEPEEPEADAEAPEPEAPATEQADVPAPIVRPREVLSVRDALKRQGIRQTEAIIMAKVNDDSGNIEDFPAYHAPHALLNAECEDVYLADDGREYARYHVWVEGLYDYDARGVLRRIGDIDEWPKAKN